MFKLIILSVKLIVFLFTFGFSIFGIIIDKENIGWVFSAAGYLLLSIEVIKKLF